MFLLARIACVAQMRAIATDVARDVVCLFACLCDAHDREPAKTAEQVETSLRRVTQ